MENDDKIEASGKKEETARPPGAVPQSGAQGQGRPGAMPQPTQPPHPPQYQHPYPYYVPYYRYDLYQYPQQPQKPPKRKRSSKPQIVGALLTISGILAIVMGMMAGVVFAGLTPMGDMMRSGMDNISDTGDVSGHVVYQNMTPVVGARITVADTGQMATTNENGYYRIISVDTGWHDLRVEMAGYRTIVQSVNIEPDGQHMHDNDEFDYTDSSDTVADFQLQPGSDSFRIGDKHEGDWNERWGEWGLAFGMTMAMVCSLLFMIFGFLAVVGGFYAFRRKNLPVVFVGCVFGILAMGFGIGIILSIVAMIVLFLCMDEFDVPKKKKGSKMRRETVEEDEEEE